MEFINGIFSFLFSKDRTVPTKLAYIISFAVLIALFEIATGFFTLLFDSQRVDQIEKIENVLAMPGVDAPTRSYLQKIKHNIITRKGYREWSSDLASLMQNAMKSDIKTSPLDKKSANTTVSIFSKNYLVYHTISSSWILLLIMVGAPLFFFFNGDQKKDVVHFASLIINEVTFAVLVYLFALLFFKIPIIGSGIWNIIINFVLHPLLFAIVVIVLGKIQKAFKT